MQHMAGYHDLLRLYLDMGLFAVSLVSEQRMTCSRKMNTYLVGPACAENGFDQGGFVEPFEYLPAGDCLFASFALCRHLLSVGI